MAGKKQNLDLMWKLLNKEVDLGEPTSFLDHVYLGCTQRQCQISKDTVDNYRPCTNREFPRREQRNYHAGKICVFLHGFMMWRVMQRNVWSDKRLNRLISYIHHTCGYRQYCHVGNTAKQCRLGLFQDSDFAGDLEDSKSTSGGTLCIFGSDTCVPITWMCKKQTAWFACSGIMGSNCFCFWKRLSCFGSIRAT